MRFLNPEGLRQVTREEMKLIDTIAMDSFRIPGAALMETAGLAVAEAAVQMLGSVDGKKVGVVCGTGNNGGDGLVAARFLSNWGAAVRVVLVGRSGVMADPDASSSLAAVQRMEIPLAAVQTVAQSQRAMGNLSASSLVVDALFGTGFSAVSGTIRDPFADVIDRMNALDLAVLSADIPSGLDANTGAKIGRVVSARLTVAMGLPKKGFFLADGPSCTGKILVADLGYPRILLSEREGLYLHRKGKPKEDGKP